MSPTAEPIPPRVRFKSSARYGEWSAFVTERGREVRVRFRRSDGPVQWRCDDCGSHRFSTCPHEIAARRAWQGTTTERTTDA